VVVDVVHQPQAQPGEDCLCLVVADGTVKLPGLLGSVVNLFMR